MRGGKNLGGKNPGGQLFILIIFSLQIFLLFDTESRKFK